MTNSVHNSNEEKNVQKSNEKESGQSRATKNKFSNDENGSHDRTKRNDTEMTNVEKGKENLGQQTQMVYVIPASANASHPYRSGKRVNEEQNPTPSPQQPDNSPEYSGFSDVEIRKVFVRKVYLILLLQLLFTLGVISVFIFVPEVKHFVQKNAFMFFIAFGIFFGVYITLICSGEMRRKFPINIILLIIFTMAASYLFGNISAYYDNTSVFMAIGICAAVCFTVTIFSFYTKFDFTTCGGILCILLLVLIIFGIVTIFIHSKIMNMVYAALGAILFSMYLAYDTQMLMGGKTIEIHPEEYVLAAIQIYLDVLYIFMFVLQLIGLNR